MECLSDIKIHEYVEGSLTAVEKSIVRDHLIVCATCRARYETYEKLEKSLVNPVHITPPPIIERNVLNMLFPRIPSYSSIFALIAASFLLLVTTIYIYFDFSNNSVIKALESTSSNWLGSIIRGISTIFSTIYAIFKAINAFFEIIFEVNIGVEIIGIAVLLLLSLGFYSVSHLLLKKIRGSNG